MTEHVTKSGLVKRPIEEDVLPEIWYLSDIHFDIVKNSRRNPPRKREDRMVNFMVRHIDKVFVLAGDFYDDFADSLAFIDRLEQLHVKSFLTLGNHDYWAKRHEQNYSYEYLNALFASKTENNKYARLLMTGRVYSVGSMKIIGDAGFTDFNVDRESGAAYTVPESIFVGPPEVWRDTLEVKNWSQDKVIALHSRWVKFAQEMIAENIPLLMVTHWPMLLPHQVVTDNDITFIENERVGLVTPEEDAIFKKFHASWFKVSSGLDDSNRQLWSIFGHVHHPYDNYHHGHDVSKQLGYTPTGQFYDISPNTFGHLVPVQTNRSLAKAINWLAPYQTNELVLEPPTIGYQRSGNSVNKEIFARLVGDPTEYLSTIAAKIKTSVSINGYVDKSGWKINRFNKVVEGAIRVLERGYQGNAFDFFTALVVTGYAYSNQIMLLEFMRPLSLYDIVRFYLELRTVNEFHDQLNINNIHKIHKSHRQNTVFEVAGNRISIPNVDGYELSPNEIAPFFDSVNTFIEDSSVDDIRKIQLPL